MANAIKNISTKGQRNKLVVVIQIYNRIASMMAGSLERGLRKAGLDYADILLLGGFNSMPSDRILEAAQNLKESGKVRFLAISGHHRPLFPLAAKRGIFDIFHRDEQRLRQSLRKIAFPLYMKQAEDGKHLYSNAKIAEKVSQKSAKKITRNTIQKWALRTNEDGTTWKGSFSKALARGKVSQGVSQGEPKSAKVIPINSAKKNNLPPKTDTSPTMEIEAAATAGRKLLADAQRRGENKPTI